MRVVYLQLKPFVYYTSTGGAVVLLAGRNEWVARFIRQRARPRHLVKARSRVGGGASMGV